MKKPHQRLELSVSALDLGPEWHVSILPNGGGKRWLEQGIDDLLAIDPAQLTRVIHRRVYDATLTGVAYHDAAGARAAMEGWAYPRTWLDFETACISLLHAGSARVLINRSLSNFPRTSSKWMAKSTIRNS